MLYTSSYTQPHGPAIADASSRLVMARAATLTMYGATCLLPDLLLGPRTGGVVELVTLVHTLVRI